MSQLKIAIAGASGRMGRMLIEAVQQADDMILAGALDVAGSVNIGTDAAAFLGTPANVIIESDLARALSGVDVLIDFTRPEGTLKHAAYCAEHGVKMIIGTTGLEQEHKDLIAAAARQTAIMLSPNMSVGVNVTLKLLEMAAKSFAEGYDIEIIEAHHRHKVDAPSGTALKMGEVIADALGRKLDDVAVYAREGITGPRDPSSIGFAAIRGGDIVGDHTVLFAGIGERIEISHKSSSRVTYAHGSLRAARFLADKQNGLYDMQDVLGLKENAMEQNVGFAQYWAQGDAVSHAVAYALLLMSIASWFYILAKTWSSWRIRRSSNALDSFWKAPTLTYAISVMQQIDSEQIYTPLALQASEAASISSKQQSAPSLNAATDPGELITRTLR
eukprot:gene10268-13188_t